MAGALLGRAELEEKTRRLELRDVDGRCVLGGKKKREEGYIYIYIYNERDREKKRRRGSIGLGI